MKFLITGVTGFIGSHLAKRLVKKGVDVMGLARKTSSKEKIDVLKKLGVKINFCDLREKRSLANLPADIDGIYHLAALLDHTISSYRPYCKTNVIGTRNLVEHYIEHGIKNSVFTSSVSAIGFPKTKTGFVDEEIECNPTTFYGKSKLECEKLLLRYFNKFGFPITILRPPTVYGPGGRNGFLETVKFVEQKTRSGRPIFHIGKGDTLVSLCYIDNLTDALVLAMKGKSKGEIFHVDDGNPYTNKEILDTISATLGKKPTELQIPRMILYTVAYANEFLNKTLKMNVFGFSRKKLEELSTSMAFDITKARRHLGYNPKSDFKGFVKKTISWYKEKELL